MERKVQRPGGIVGSILKHLSRLARAVRLGDKPRIIEERTRVNAGVDQLLGKKALD